MSSVLSGVLPMAALIGASQLALAQGPAGTSSTAEDGQLAFNNACRTCHTLREGDNRLGPTLHNVIGRKAGTVPGYGYSSAMADAGIVWDRGTLDRFIANPDEVVRGNNVKPYGGIASAEERARILAYLEASGAGN
jgi:cytochrome c